MKVMAIISSFDLSPAVLLNVPPFSWRSCSRSDRKQGWVGCLEVFSHNTGMHTAFLRRVVTSRAGGLKLRINGSTWIGYRSAFR